MCKLYNSLSDFLKNKFGCKVFKVSINVGLTCPNRDGAKGAGGCIYCKSEPMIPLNHERGMGIKEQLYQGIEYIKKRHSNSEKFIAYFQMNTNTYAPVSTLKKFYEQALDHPDVVAIAVSTRPDCVGDEALDLFERIAKEKFLWLELGLQSAHDKTLKLLNRCHTAQDFTDAVRRAQQRGITVCSHVILGLPGENREEMLATARFLANLGIWGVKLHHLHILKGTKLEEMYKRGKVKLPALEEYANLAVDFLEEIPDDVVIHRLCGDTARRFLVAPEWSVNKFVILDSIHKILKRRGAYQGANMQKNENHKREKGGFSCLTLV